MPEGGTGVVAGMKSAAIFQARFRLEIKWWPAGFWRQSLHLFVHKTAQSIGARIVVWNVGTEQQRYCRTAFIDSSFSPFQTVYSQSDPVQPRLRYADFT